MLALLRIVNALMLSLVCTVVAQAQDVALRDSLAALRRSAIVNNSTDQASRFDSTRQLILERDRSNVGFLLAAGIARLRLGEVMANRAYLYQSQALFDESIYNAPSNWPWPWYGLALADLALDSVGAVVKPSMHSGAGVYYRDAALHALGQALAADSSFLPAATLLGSVLLPFGERSLNGELVRAVRRAAATNQASSPWLLLGRVYRNLHEPDSATAAFRRYANLGGNPGLALLEEARSLYGLGRAQEATRAYLAGAAIADSLARDAYRLDLAWVASPEELAAFDAAPRDSVGSFVGAFWTKRDAEELRAPGERLAEHVRRWRYVFEHFQVNHRGDSDAQERSSDCGPGIIPSLRDDPHVNAPSSMPGLITQAASPDLQLLASGTFASTFRGRRVVDDRGLIYMRHGAPTQRASAHLERTQPWTAQPGSRVTEPTPAQLETRPNESWKYVTAHGSLLFHFCGSLALGTSAATTLVAMLPLNPEMIGARSGLDPRFAALEGELRRTDASGRSIVLTGNSSGMARRLTESLVRDGRNDIAVGLSTDDFAPEFAHEIRPLAQFFALGQPGFGTGRVLTVFAFAGEQLTPTPLARSGVAYILAFRLIATDAQGHVRRQDTTRYFSASDTLREGQYLYGTVELPLDSGTWDVKLLVTQPNMDAGGAIERQRVTLVGGAELGLSDLVFGREASGLVWRSPDGAVPLSPLDAYPRSGTVEVYYELSGAESGRQYQTQLELTGVSGDAEGDVRLEFTEEAHDRVLRLRRSVALDPLKGGQYRMTVTLTELGTKRTVTRSRLLNVRR